MKRETVNVRPDVSDWTAKSPLPSIDRQPMQQRCI